MRQLKQNRWLVLLPAILGALVWSVSPFLNFNALADGTPSPSPLTTYLQASLTGTPINNSTPFGRAEYKVFSNGTRKLTVDVFSVNLPANTQLQVLINNVSAGNITVSAFRSGRLELRTETGTVPTVQAGQAVEIRFTQNNTTTTVLSGTFNAVTLPSPSATRTPSGSPTGTRTPAPSPVPPLFASLTGAVVNGAAPSGLAQYTTFWNNTRELEVFVNVNLPANTVLSIFVGNSTTAIGTITLQTGGRGHFESQASTLPQIAVGTPITIKNAAGATILSGTFSNTRPTPTPRPSVSPSGSPTPNPSPRPARFFSARLNGGQVVPPVTTQARGDARILLNEAENQIQVSVAFFGLSSNQTTATINGPALPGANGAVIFNLGTVGGTSGFVPVQTFAVTAAQVAQLRAGMWYVQIGSVNNPTGEIRGQIRARHRFGDFEGDGLVDVSVFRPTEGKWYFLNSSDGAFRSTAFGAANDKVVTGDFDGDGVSDAAVFTAQNGLGVWKINRSYDGGTTAEQWGLASDVPVVGDFDGDGRNDLSVFRPSAGDWYIKTSADNNFVALHWGADGDRPIAGDYDGDGRDDIGVFRPSSGNWYILRSSDNQMHALQWGVSGDIPVVGDFDGDGRDDVGVYRASAGAWYILQSMNNELKAVQFGAPGDIPVAGEFDGDGVADIAVFRPSNGYWYILKSDDNSFAAVQFGAAGDKPSIGNQ